jgi:hypothetical protein
MKARVVIAAVLALGLSGCPDPARESNDRCADHGGVADLTGPDIGTPVSGNEAQTVCADGTRFVYEGWNVQEIEATE